jgi:60 kDa SS-A/Ro ribonucleoprotein
VKKSKQLPFRFLSAYQALVGKPGEKITFEKDVDGLKKLQKAIEKAVDSSIQNIPDLPGRTVILTDNSGSMRGDYGGNSALSAYSKRTTANIANLFAAMYWLKAENTYVGVFGDKLEQPKLDRTKSLFDNYKIIDKVGQHIGGATEHGAFECFRNLVSEKTKVDRVIMFTDCQLGEGWYGTSSGESGGSFNKLYKQFKAINPEAKVYCVDLKGYGNTLFSDGAFSISGWSDKLFDIMAMVEKKEGFVKWIENYSVQLSQ